MAAILALKISNIWWWILILTPTTAFHGAKFDAYNLCDIVNWFLYFGDVI